MKVSYILLALLLALATACPLAHGQTMVPQPASEGDVLTLRAVLPQMSCFYSVESTEISRSSSAVLVRYVVHANTGVPCFTINPLLTLEIAIGSFTQGSYTVSIEGAASGVPNPPQSATFTVGASGSGLDPVSIPGASVWSISLGVLLLIAFALASLAMRSSGSRG